jgi:hypothetical protein
MTQTSRIELARRRIRLVRYTSGVLAAAAFATFAVAARNAHPGTASTGSSTAGNDGTAVTSSDDYSDDQSSDSFGFGSSSVSPSYNSAPSVQSEGS